MDNCSHLRHSELVHTERSRPQKIAIPLLGVALIGLFVVWAVRSGGDGNCESIPIPKFNLQGVTYTARTAGDIVPREALGDVLATQSGGVADGLLRCQDLKLKSGQGSLPTGAHVYSIRGIDKSVAIAAQTGTGYMKLYAP
jgi:hypothetical protein